MNGRLALDGLWLLLVLLVTLAGVWLSSSLAAYHNGPLWLAWALGLLAFPILPLAWEAWAAMRGAKKDGLRRPFFTVWDRIVLRTLAVNLLIVGVMLARWPTTAFAALATQGTGSSRTGRAGRRRACGCFCSAPREASSGSTARRTATPTTITSRARGVVAEPEAAPVPIAQGATRPPDASSNEGTGSLDASDFDFGRTGRPPAVDPQKASRRRAGPERLADGTPAWPFRRRFTPRWPPCPRRRWAASPRRRAYRRAEEGPVEAREGAPRLCRRRVSYDVESIARGEYPPQDARRSSACGDRSARGDANSWRLMGEASGNQIVVVGGDARRTGAT